MKKPTRSKLYLSDLKKVKGQYIADVSIKTGYLNEPKTNEPPVSDLTKPGFYFLVFPETGAVVARFFLGRQRSKSGFRSTVSHLKSKRSSTGVILASTELSKYSVVFVSLDKMKALTNGYGKGKWALKFTRQHVHEFQNIQEMNRMLNDHFKFYAQGY